MKNEIGSLAKSDEDVLTYACFPQIAKDYLKEKYEEKNSEEKISIQNIDVVF